MPEYRQSGCLCKQKTVAGRHVQSGMCRVAVYKPSNENKIYRMGYQDTGRVAVSV
jgi:hypothetical protein